MAKGGELIDLDGSTLAGGGQTLRIALALSSILSKPFRITNIRHKRAKPGLQRQHLTGVLAMAEITGAKVEGAEMESTELSFSPQKIRPGSYTFDIGTAGSITLLAQSLLPAMLFAGGRSVLTLKGGTHVSWSPNIDEYSNVFLPIIRGFGAEASLAVKSLGWFPKGGGEAVFTVNPSKLFGREMLEKGDRTSIAGVCSLSGLDPGILDREEEGITEVFPNTQITRIVSRSPSPGTSVTLWANFQNTVIGSSKLGEIGLRAEKLGKLVAEDLKNTISTPATVDRWQADQLLIFMALARGKSSIIVPEITDHMKTCAWVIPKFTSVPFQIEGNKVTIEGIGDSL